MHPPNERFRFCDPSGKFASDTAVVPAIAAAAIAVVWAEVTGVKATAAAVHRTDAAAAVDIAAANRVARQATDWRTRDRGDARIGNSTFRAEIVRPTARNDSGCLITATAPDRDPAN
jgi:uncharacterized protein (UPF0333 family)